MGDGVAWTGLTPTPPASEEETLAGGRAGVAWVCVGGGVSAVTKGAGSCAGPGPSLTIGGRRAGSSHSRSDISEPRPRQHQGRGTQGRACHGLGPGVVIRSGGPGTAYSHSCPSASPGSCIQGVLSLCFSGQRFFQSCQWSCPRLLEAWPKAEKSDRGH